jgi:hypothetical protein
MGEGLLSYSGREKFRFTLNQNKAALPFVVHQTFEAMVKTESNYQPLAIGVNGGSKLQRQPANLEEAIVTAQETFEHRQRGILD